MGATGKCTSMVTGPLIVTIIANLMGSFQYGFNIGAASNIQDVVEEFMNVTITQRQGEVPSGVLVANLWAVIVAIYFLGGAVGSVVYKWLSQHTSRRGTMLMNILLGLVASALMFSARRAERWELLFVGRLLVGIHVGIYTSLVSIYLAEISPKEIRGAVANLNPVGLTTALFLGQALGFPDFFGTKDSWDILVGLAVVPCVVQLCLLPFCVESPRYLMLSKKDTKATREALQRLRDSEDVEDEIQVMQEEMDNVVDTVTLVEMWKNLPSRRATIVALLAHLSLHLCGLNGPRAVKIFWLLVCMTRLMELLASSGTLVQLVLFYSNNLFQEFIGLSSTDAAYVTSSIGILSIVMTLVITPLTEVAGRRTLQFIGLIGLCVDTVLITVCLLLRHHVEAFGTVAIVFLLAFIIVLNIGPGCIPWILVGEVFSQNARPIGSAIAMAGNWLSGFLVAYAFYPMAVALQDYVFIPFCVITILIAVHTYFNLPETKGKTIQEIVSLFEKPGDNMAELNGHDKTPHPKNVDPKTGTYNTFTPSINKKWPSTV